MRRNLLILLSAPIGLFSASGLLGAVSLAPSDSVTLPVRTATSTLPPKPTVSPGTAVTASVTAVPVRSPALRLLDADLASLLLRQKTLNQAGVLKQTEMRDLQTRSTQSWEQTRLPVASAQLAETQRELAQVNLDLETVRQKIAKTERAESIAPLAPAAANTPTRELLVSATPAQRAAAAQAVAQKSQRPLRRITLDELMGPDQATTERNLQTALAAAQQSGAILFFDEADALFGKRSNVQDSHDRYANQETSYLLQRLEGYSGQVLIGVKTAPSDSASTLLSWPRVTLPTPSPTPRP